MTRTLGDYFALQRGTTYKSRLLGQPGPLLLGLGTIERNGGFRSDSLKTYGGNSAGKLLVRPGELYVSLKDVTQSADLLGAVARLPKWSAPGRLTQDTVKLEARFDDTPLTYLYWVMRTPRYRDYCRTHATGTTNLGLSREDFLAFPVPEPNSQQLTIVDLLDDLESRLDLNRRTSETLEAMARALFQSWFIDFDPVRAKADGEPADSICERLRLTPELLALFPDVLEDTHLGVIPDGWHPTTLGRLCVKIGSGATPRGGREVYVDEGVALIRSQNVYDAEFRWDGLARLSHDAAEQLRNVDVRLNDVLLNITGASILRTCLVDPTALPARVNQHVAIVRAAPGVPARYIHLHLLRRSTKEYLLGLNAGASREAVTKAHIESVPVIRPPKPLLAQFESITAATYAEVELKSRDSRALAATRDALLPELLSGDLRVPAFEE